MGRARCPSTAISRSQQRSMWPSSGIWWVICLFKTVSFACCLQNLPPVSVAIMMFQCNKRGVEERSVVQCAATLHVQFRSCAT